MESLKEIALRELESTTCPNCGHGKGKGDSFCNPCYVTLPRAARAGLYRALPVLRRAVVDYTTYYNNSKRILRDL